MRKKSTKPRKSPDKLGKTAKPSGVKLTETELGQATGGYTVKL